MKKGVCKGMARAGQGLLWLVLVALLCGAAPAARAADEEVASIPIYFFHDTVCGSCDGTAEFLALFAQTLPDARDIHPYTLDMYNTFHSTGGAVYRRMLSELGLADAGLEPPLVIVGGKALAGMERIAAGLREAFLLAAEAARLPGDLFAGLNADQQETTLLYFYHTTCTECDETTPVLDALPESVTVGGQSSAVRVLAFNAQAGSGHERLQALFAHYGVPEEKQQVPIVFLTDTYLSGYAEIARHLPASLEAGAGRNFQFPQVDAP